MGTTSLVAHAEQNERGLAGHGAVAEMAVAELWLGLIDQQKTRKTTTALLAVLQPLRSRDNRWVARPADDADNDADAPGAIGAARPRISG